MKKICVTGANGFIGASLIKKLSELNYQTHVVARKALPNINSSNVNFFFINDIHDSINLDKALYECDCLVHCAGKTNLNDKKNDINEYFKINTIGTKNLALQAAKHKVKKFLYLSTIKVNGENSENNKDKIFRHEDIPNPKDPYALSKFKAEKSLCDISSKTGMALTILRIPLVYGFGSKGNLNNLIKLIKIGIPLPFRSIKNKRSLIGIDNLVDVIIRCITHPNAAGKTFLVSDGKDVSIVELIELIATAMDQKVKIFKMPIIFLKFFGFIFRKQNIIDRLIKSLRIDNKHVSDTLGWSPPFSLKEGIERMLQKNQKFF